MGTSEDRDVLANQGLRVVVAVIGRQRAVDVDDRIVRRSRFNDHEMCGGGIKRSVAQLQLVLYLFAPSDLPRQNLAQFEHLPTRRSERVSLMSHAACRLLVGIALMQTGPPSVSSDKEALQV